MNPPKYEYKSYWQDIFTQQEKGQYLNVLIDQMSEYSFKTVLELGSGTGHVSHEIKNNFPCHLTGIDIAGSNGYLDESIHADITEYETEKRYDLIVARYVLMHIKPEDIQDTLSKLFKWAGNIIIIDYDPLVEIPLADFNFRHDYSMFPYKRRLSAYNSMWFT